MIKEKDLPDSPVHTAPQKPADLELRHHDIAAVGVDSSHDPRALPVAQEPPRLSVRVREVD